MKKIIIILVALMPLAALAGNGKKDTANLKLNISLSTDKNGNLQVKGVSKKDLKKLQKEINAAIKNINITFTDDDGKHVLNLQGEININ